MIVKVARKYNWQKKKKNKGVRDASLTSNKYSSSV